MERRILVPLDGSEVGEAVLPKIEELILSTSPSADFEVTLLHVISKLNFNMLTDDDSAQLPYSESDMKELTQKAQDYLGRVAERLTSKGICVKTTVTAGHAAEEIVNTARAMKANLIAMSSHGRDGFARWAIGSVTGKVLRLEGTIPVLAVRPQPKQEANPVIALESLHSLTKSS